MGRPSAPETKSGRGRREEEGGRGGGSKDRGEEAAGARGRAGDPNCRYFSDRGSLCARESARDWQGSDQGGGPASGRTGLSVSSAGSVRASDSLLFNKHLRSG